MPKTMALIVKVKEDWSNEDGFKSKVGFQARLGGKNNLNQWKKRQWMKNMRSMLFLYNVNVLSLTSVLTL